LRADLARAHASFGQLAAEVQQQPLDQDQQAALKRAIEREQALIDRVAAVPRKGLDLREVRGLSAAMVDDAYQVLAVSYFVADREVERLGASADEVHRRLIVMVLIATAIALAAALALTRLIARPIAELDSAIRQLGGADFERPIQVSGPADLRSLGERLDWLRLRLTELEAQKNRFLRHLSHDLKTPLAALREGTELLNDQVAGPLAPPQRQVVAILRDNSVKLQRLIEDLLDYQRALHAASGLQVGSVAMDALLKQSLRSHQLAAQGKALRIGLDSSTFTIWGDAAKLRSVIDNLLGNAVKFTPAGGEIRVLAREQGGLVTIDVRRQRRRRAAGGARGDLRGLLSRPCGSLRARRGHGPWPGDRARVHRGARRPHRGGRGHARRAFPRDAAAAPGDAGGGRMKAALAAPQPLLLFAGCAANPQQAGQSNAAGAGAGECRPQVAQLQAQLAAEQAERQRSCAPPRGARKR
jgi:signal transduction histidine kinase